MDNNMFIDCVSLRFFPGQKCVFIRELCGHEEQSIRGTRSSDAIKLLNGLLADNMNSNAIIGKAGNITIYDRDRILSAIYLNTYGSKIETTIICDSCKKPFDIDFSLEEMVNNLNVKKEIEKVEKDSDYVFRLENGVHFRLPTGEDEAAILGNSVEDIEKELTSRCLIESNDEEDLNNVIEVAQILAPLINFNFDASCTECNWIHNLHFDIQHYLLSSLLQDQKQLAFEVHKLAHAYKWGLNEILDLPRSIRRSYVSLID